ncbi:Polyisoprenoid-binding protein YceI [Mucilaginibacter pineti]|uniref:Polyisoprenoid-binding protein YceI n=2 Tax=Mucilaginibacter pineti TaxID=1391627 RepID=A0A1G7C4Q0_9SPHI|nr:Polyisoprenoid-binding protein YceI [Mucilaginibacter pineti]
MFQLAANAQQTYQLDIKKSKILWDARKTMGGHYGYLLFNSGSLSYSAGGEPMGAAFSLDMNSMKSTDHNPDGNKKVDDRLKTDGFFATVKYPSAIINIKKIMRVGQSTTFKVAGELTMKGITNPIEFTAIIKKKGNIVNAAAETKIDRVKWHIDFQPKPKSWDFIAALTDKIITDEIGVSLNLVFTK